MSDGVPFRKFETGPQSLDELRLFAVGQVEYRDVAVIAECKIKRVLFCDVELAIRHGDIRCGAEYTRSIGVMRSLDYFLCGSQVGVDQPHAWRNDLLGAGGCQGSFVELHRCGDRIPLIQPVYEMGKSCMPLFVAQHD